ncbi:hypothetical protein SELMODRAFT_427053 [Selaginella moellendorffii]|uniref:Uncharacterized protein n=1 Tax=Selaginella moellendorffii TaxID=88036 RepID=D8SYD0_SELML|nr:hypothetical protein SELMODRAFT_427053 [Selaginella moellendorffii]
MRLLGQRPVDSHERAAEIAVQSLNILKGMSVKAPDPGRLDECLTCLAFSSWQGMSKQEILGTLLRLGVTVDYLASKHRVLLSRLTERPVEKPLPSVDDHKRRRSLQQAKQEKQQLLSFYKLLDAWKPSRWSRSSHRLKKAYSSLMDEAKPQAEAAMRKKCRGLLLERSSGNDFFIFNNLFMSCSMRGFQMLAIQLTMNSQYLHALKRKASSSSSSLALLLEFLSRFLELMLGGILLRMRDLRLVFIHWCAVLLEEVEVAESNICWKHLIELSTTLLSEDEEKLLQLLCKTCRPTNHLLHGMRVARKNTNAEIRSHGPNIVNVLY